MGACLPLLIQMPILIALYWVISGITDVANTYHLYSFLGSFDPTKVNLDFFGVNLLHIGGTLGVIAGVILAVFQWLQSYVAFSAQPPMPKQEPQEQKDGEMPSIDPNIMKNMTLYFMPIMMGVFGIFLPLGIALYIWIGSVFGIVQQMYVNIRAKKHKKKGEIVKR